MSSLTTTFTIGCAAIIATELLTTAILIWQIRRLGNRTVARIDRLRAQIRKLNNRMDRMESRFSRFDDLTHKADTVETDQDRFEDLTEILNRILERGSRSTQSPNPS